MLSLGAISIIAAIKYTLGKKAYGYHGLGDLFVFLFFGLLNVVGSWFLMTHQVTFTIFLPAVSCGLLSTGVLNLNNMRDIENDKEYNKHTIPVLIGINNAKIYHFSLVICAFIMMTVYATLFAKSIYGFSFLLSLPLFIVHLKKVGQNQGRLLDPQLKVLSLSTLLFALLAGLIPT